MPSVATMLSDAGGRLPKVAVEAFGARTEQAFVAVGAGLVPKNSLVQLTVPDSVFCTAFRPAPYCTTVADGRLNDWP